MIRKLYYNMHIVPSNIFILNRIIFALLVYQIVDILFSAIKSF